MRNLKASLENSLEEVETHYAMQMEQFNGILLHLESELDQTRAEGQRQAQGYETLLNIKVSWRLRPSPISTCWKKGRTSIWVDNSHSIHCIQKTTYRRLVDGRVVSEVNNPKVLRH